MPSMTILIDSTIPVAEDFNGNFRRLNQAVGVNTTIANYARGDLVYASTTDTLVRLPIGNAGEVLGSRGGLPAWSGSSAVIGTWQQRNLQGTLSASSLSVTADSVVLRSAELAIKVHESVSAISLDPSVTGLNGRDQLTAFTASQDLWAYWISDGVFIRGVWADSAPPTGPDLATLPAFAGYSYWCPIAAAKWTAASMFVPARIRGRMVFYEGPQIVISDGQAAVETAVSVAGFVPAAAPTWLGLQLGSYEGLPTYNLRFRLISGVDYDIAPGGTNGASSVRAEITWPNVGQQYYYRFASPPGATFGHYGYVRGYSVGNGGE